MGTVYLAEDTSLGRLVALKVLNPHLSSDEEFVTRFRHEARAIAGLSHPNIVQIHCLEPHPQGLVIDMEYVDGVPMNEFLSRRRAQPPEIVAIARQVLQGLAVCHAKGIVHRDVKPGNILIGCNGQVLLADFGLATAYATYMEHSIATTRSASVFVGTPHYAPLEAWNGVPPTPAWDVYSVGRTMYEALVGHIGLEGRTALSIVKELLEQPLIPPRERNSEVSEELSALVVSMLQENPEARPANAAEALALLNETPEGKATRLSDMPTVPGATPFTFSDSLRKTPRKWLRPIVAMAAIVVLSAAGSALGAYFMYHGGNTELRKNPTTDEPSRKEPVRPVAGFVTEAQLLQTTKSSASEQPQFYDTSILETGSRQTAHWMMQQPDAASTCAIVAAGDRDLWHMLMTQTDRRLKFAGAWAEYQDDTGARFRSGQIEGMGEWLTVGRSLVASLQFHCDQDNSSWKYSVSATATDTAFTDVQFLHRMEAAPLTQPLLYLELMPRHLEWASYVEGLLPCIPESRVVVPIMSESEASIEVDGRLTEPVWTTKYYGENGRIGEIKGRPQGRGAGLPQGRGAILRLRATPASLLMALRVPEIPHGQHFSFTLSLTPTYAIPMSQSPTFRLSISPDGDHESSLYRGTKETPWQCDWQIATLSDKNYWNLEMVVPVKGLGISHWPDPDKAWRLNAELRSPEEGGSEWAVAQWGYPDAAATAHGMIVHFANVQNGGQGT